MKPGTCRKCHSQGQRYYEGIRRDRCLKCFACGFIEHYLAKDGTIYVPPLYMEDDNLDPAAIYYHGCSNGPRTINRPIVGAGL